MTKTLGLTLLLLLALGVYGAAACGPNGCAVYRGHPYYGAAHPRYHEPYNSPYGEHRRGGYGCAWVGGVRVCR
jgi:hypothetical protein